MKSCIKILNFYSKLNLFKVGNFGETNQFTKLCPCLKNVDPDESFSSIPYEKGHMFLYHLEELLGGPGNHEHLWGATVRLKFFASRSQDWANFR